MKHSLRFRLLFFVLTSFIVGWLMISGFTWWRAAAEADALFDEQLFQLATLLAVVTSHEAEEQDLDEFAEDMQVNGYNDPPVFQVWSSNGQLLVHGPNAPREPLSLNFETGYSNEMMKGRQWRVYTRYTSDKQHRIQVAQESASREVRMLGFVVNILSPLLLALPMIGVLWWVVVRALNPLDRLVHQIGARSATNLEAIDTAIVPVEAKVLVDAINDLFQKLQLSIERYNRFTADAAHELRTPLAGSVVQIQAALESSDEGERKHSLNQALKGLSKLNRLVEQLLVFSRMEPDVAMLEFAFLDLKKLSVEVVSEYVPGYLEKSVSLELEAPHPVTLKGNWELLSIVLRNLLDNAVRVTPAGGVIKVSLLADDNFVTLMVIDAGPGIADQNKALVFGRFHRLLGTTGQGSGLGLSIVHSAVRLHGGTVMLEDGDEGKGLRVVIKIPIRSAFPSEVEDL
ncbi:MAG: sensor histidine kinase N-terminal domain-containing protein [gamma proteobacterium endosymbiont of Lamellibrachia anaximandri]|nr:sensor histidine kinase N-terminal domain-containing protein [gamma proteobacterium endosymbiont of Lamellibrachia anaximandri]